MAPRGRSKKRDKKMDAAIETMTKEYGISDVEVIKKVANELLNEYGGGDDAWYFIEQYTYLELLEAIVRYREANPWGNNVQGGAVDNHAPKDAAGPSSVVAEPVRSEVVEKGLEKAIKDDTNNLSSTERDGKDWKDIGLDQSSSKRYISNAAFVVEENNGSNEDPDTGPKLSPAQLIPTTPLISSVPNRSDTSPLLSPLSLTDSPKCANSVPPRRRLPCYGWIESDEEDIDDFIELKSAEYRSCGVDTKAKRRKRWDLRPDDP